MSGALLYLARKIAKENHLFIVEVSEKNRPAWVVYRSFESAPAQRQGRRRDPAELLRFVKQCAGITTTEKT